MTRALDRFGYIKLAAAIAGVFMVFSFAVLGGIVHADTGPASQSTGLQAVIPADPPSVAPTITTPQNGQVVTAIPITVSGLCTGDVLVKVFSNGVFVGSVQCKNGSYTLSVDLFSGENEIIVRIYDALDQKGPDSQAVRVTYSQSGFNASGPRVSLTSFFAKRGANPNEDLEWPFSINGRTGPFAVSVNWGDGTTDLISRSAQGLFTAKHTYTSAGTYTVVVKVTDANGNTAFLQVVAVANGAVQNNTSDVTQATVREVVLWWPLAVAAVLTFVAFWLGRKDQLTTLRRQAEKRVRY